MAQITFNQIPFSSTDLNAPGRGAEDWHNQNNVNIPSEGTKTQRLDAYFRSQLTWCQLEKGQGQYDFAPLTKLLNSCIDKKQKMSFGTMSVYHDNEPVVTNYDGAMSSYPEYLHNLMKSESVKDWKVNYGNSSGWVPNYNSQHYLGRLKALNVAINNVLETGSYNGVKYKDIIYVIDVRGYGNYGEWHNGGLVDQVSQIPSGAHATTATLKAIIDAHTSAFPNFQLNIIMTAFDANFLQHTRTAPEVGWYALTTSNAHGKLGWRRDNWGAGDGTGDTYIDDLLIDNNRSFNGVALNSLIMKVWQYAPITGEPMNSTSNSFSELEAQVRKYHATSFGNGNITSSPNAATKNNFRAASKTSGYRLVVESADVTTAGKVITVKMNWHNVGIAPTYENWNITFELVDSTGKVAFMAVSSFKLRLFLPQSSATVATDTLNVPASVPAGTYSLRFTVKDPTGYRNPLPLAINGTNGVYSLGSVNLSGVTPPPPPPPVNVGPVANAGGDKEITLPTDFVTLQGTGTDADGSIQTMIWKRISGSGVVDSSMGPWGNTTIRQLLAGTSVFELTVVDDKGASHSDRTSIKVNPAIVPPPDPDPDPDPVGKKVVEVRTASTVKTISTVVYDDGSQEVFPKV